MKKSTIKIITLYVVSGVMLALAYFLRNIYFILPAVLLHFFGRMSWLSNRTPAKEAMKGYNKWTFIGVFALMIVFFVLAYILQSMKVLFGAILGTIIVVVSFIMWLREKG